VEVGGVNVFLWHVHGSWTTNFVQGAHEYFVPVTPDRGPDGRGRAQTWEWPPSVHEVPVRSARDLDVDVVVLQRPEELTDLTARWLGGRRPGLDLPAVYLEHNAPQGLVNTMRHPAADRPDIVLVHVTHHNALFWDGGVTPTCVIEHGVVDPGYRYDGELTHAVVVVNEPVRRGRVVGADLLSRFARVSALDVFGMETHAVGGLGDLAQAQLHDELPRRRTYLHPYRWTSLGLALVEAMHLGMPVVAIGTTGANEAVPPEAGVVSTRVDVLEEALRRFNADHELATATGKAARMHALEVFGLARFLEDWDGLLVEVTR
jgi:hypothetical protein